MTLGINPEPRPVEYAVELMGCEGADSIRHTR